MKTLFLFGLLLMLSVVSAGTGTSPTENNVDNDKDGIPDQLEQALLERFQPTFMLSPADCDLLPAEFLAGSEAPRVVAANGTIYGQVFPHPFSAGDKQFGDKQFVEIHYYHLWGRDCGRTGHPLDAEHVAALASGTQSEPLSSWKAVYWFAAAHQETLCDTSTAPSGRHR